MPKLLQKSILKSSVISFLFALSAFVYLCIFERNTYCFFNSAIAVFYSPELAATLFLFKLPDYMYVAPYSENQREKLLKKGQTYKFLSIYVWIIVLVLLPVTFMKCRGGSTEDVVLCLTEIILSTSILYTNAFLKFIGQIDIVKMVVIVFARAIVIFIFAGCMDLGNVTGAEKTIEFIMIAIIAVFSVFLVVYCRLKYYDMMINCMADYEYVHRNKKK